MQQATVMNTRQASLLSQPWYYNLGFDPALRSTWNAFVQSREKELHHTSELPKRPLTTLYGDPVRQVEWRDSLAIIPVDGSLVKGALPSDKLLFGDTADEDIQEDIESAVNSGAKAILLHFRSPGGTVMGAPEFAGAVAQLQADGFPIFAFTDELMASKAYDVAAGATGIFATESALVGSIGTVLQTFSIERLLDRAGVDAEIFTSGDLKATGSPVKRLTDPQSAYLQGVVDGAARVFLEHVEKYRGAMDKEVSRGAVFTAKQALDYGLIDGIARNRREVEDMILGASV